MASRDSLKRFIEHHSMTEEREPLPPGHHADKYGFSQLEPGKIKYISFVDKWHRKQIVMAAHACGWRMNWRMQCKTVRPFVLAVVRLAGEEKILNGIGTKKDMMGRAPLNSKGLHHADKYRFGTMEVRSVVFFRFRSPNERLKYIQAAHRYGERSGMKFTTKTIKKGIMVVARLA